MDQLDGALTRQPMRHSAALVDRETKRLLGRWKRGVSSAIGLGYQESSSASVADQWLSADLPAAPLNHRVFALVATTLAANTNQCARAVDALTWDDPSLYLAMS